jgi:predicted outer membrane protein
VSIQQDRLFSRNTLIGFTCNELVGCFAETNPALFRRVPLERARPHRVGGTARRRKRAFPTPEEKTMNRKHIAGIGAGLLMLSASSLAYAATDEEFLKAAIGINLAEIDAGQMAQDKGESDGVKEFGKMLVDDHKKSNEEALKLAKDNKITPPNAASEKEQQEAQKLTGLSGTAFDTEFVNHMAMGHEEAIAMFKDKADDGDNAISTFAKDTLPALEKHLERAQSLMQEEGTASADGSRAMGSAMSGASTGSAPPAGAPNAADKMGSEASSTTPDAGTVDGTAQNYGTSATSETGAKSRSEGLKPVEIAAVSSDALVGATVYGADDENVGEVSELIVSESGTKGQVDAVVIDVGGFLGIGEKPVAIEFKGLQIMADASNKYYIYSKFTREQLENAPEYDKATFKDNRDRMILRSIP